MKLVQHYHEIINELCIKAFSQYEVEFFKHMYIHV